MRIIGGTHRSIPLASVGKGDVGAHLRPTTDRVRESLFNVLMHLDVIPGARVLDLFAGTGALGLEALSRGADHVSFVDDGRVAQRLISENISKLKVESQTDVIRRDVTRLGTCTAEPYSLIFLDPPYGQNLGGKTLERLMQDRWFSPDAFVVWEENTPMDPPEGFSLQDRRRYGDTHVTMLLRAG